MVRFGGTDDPGPWAAFDFPDQPPGRTARLRGKFSRPPAEVILANSPDEVPQAVRRAWAAARSGAWVLGGLTFAAGWDPAMVALRGDESLAHFEVYPDPPQIWAPTNLELPALEWRPEPSLASGLEPEQGISQVLTRIAKGECYQVNLTTTWRTCEEVDLYTYFLGLLSAQPGGYAIYSRLAGVASVSPELFFDFREDRILTQPMKGTAGIDTDGSQLRQSQKDRAENLMIVDLLRNDLGRICRPGTVGVDRLFQIHRLPTLWQMTSTVYGQVVPGTSLEEVFAALFPCGSVTGAPKLAAMKVISDLEANPRGWYCGALGIIRPGGTATYNVAIRSVVKTAEGLSCGVGSGIVADSEPAQEFAEWEAKLGFLGAAKLQGLETILLSHGRLARGEAHLARLESTCRELGLRLDRAEVVAKLAEVISQHPGGRWRVRLVAGGGPVSIEVSPAPLTATEVVLGLAQQPLDARGYLGPVIRNKTTYRAHYTNMAMPGVFDVICHNKAGELTECTTGNLAVQIEGRWFTPPESAGLLPGVLRGELLTSGRLGERTLLIDDLRRAEGLAFLNSLRGWCPARLADARLS